MQYFKRVISAFLVCAILTFALSAGSMSASAAYAHNEELASTAVNEYNRKDKDSSIANGTKYQNAYGLNGSWCVMFAWWCADHVGVKTSVVPKEASASEMETKIGGNGGTVHTNVGSYQPKVGDFVHLSYHLMVVTSVSGNYVTVTHGNWGGTMSQNTYNWKTEHSFGGQTILSYVSPWHVGDEDHDYELTTTDARVILQMASGEVAIPALPSKQFLRVDVDGNLHITTTDARIALQMCAGKA